MDGHLDMACGPTVLAWHTGLALGPSVWGLRLGLVCGFGVCRSSVSRSGRVSLWHVLLWFIAMVYGTGDLGILRWYMAALVYRVGSCLHYSFHIS